MLVGFFDRVFFNVALFACIAGIIYFVTSRAFKNRYHLLDELLDADMEANSARRREVEEEYFYAAQIDSLPVRDNAEGDVAKKQEHVLNCAQQKMVHFPQKMSNIELKNAYGVANLEKVTGFEENYNRYVMALVDWADALLETGGVNEKADAIAILESTVALGSEFRKTYIHLADYYFEKAKADGLEWLLEKVAELFSDEGIKRQVTQYIMDKKESL